MTLRCPPKADLRELVIGRGSRRYLALCCYAAEIDTVFVLAIGGQLEAGYDDSWEPVTPKASWAPTTPK